MINEQRLAATISIRRISGALLILGLGLACRDSNNVSGPPALAHPSPTPAAASHTNTWDLTSRVVGDSGPDFCIHTATVGSVYHGTYTILRNGSTVSFTPADFIDWESYNGTLQDTTFTASNAPVEFGPANGMCAHYFQASTLNGTFSPDGNNLTATETWSFRLDSGQVKTLTFQWSAIRR